MCSWCSWYYSPCAVGVVGTIAHVQFVSVVGTIAHVRFVSVVGTIAHVQFVSAVGTIAHVQFVSVCDLWRRLLTDTCGMLTVADNGSTDHTRFRALFLRTQLQ